MNLIDWLQAYLNLILWVAGGVLVALWLAVVVWAFRDIRSRTRSTLAVVVVTLMVLLLSIFGLGIYLLLRPRQTLSESYDRALEQEALLQQIEEKPVCPTCSRPTQSNWFLCPHCHTHLRQPCPVCNSPLELHWDICPYCGYLFQPENPDGTDSVLDEAEYISHQPDSDPFVPPSPAYEGFPAEETEDYPGQE